MITMSVKDLRDLLSEVEKKINGNEVKVVIVEDDATKELKDVELSLKLTGDCTLKFYIK